MRHQITYAVALMFLLFGSAQAQENSTAERDESSDPCSRFHLRLFRPPAGVDYKLRTHRPDERFNYSGVIINLCPAGPSLLVFAPPTAPPEITGSLIRLPESRLRFGPEGGERRAPSGVFGLRLPRRAQPTRPE